MSFSVVIPARYASSRLPAKPLADIAGKPMIQRVYEQACLSSAEQVIVATDDQRIADAVSGFGGRCVLTSKEHQSGTDRLQEVAVHLGCGDDDILVNVQGDEPLIPPGVIDQVAVNLQKQSEAVVATLAEPLKNAEELFDPNVVKVVTDCNGLALYFSRAPMPWARDAFANSQDELPDGAPYRRHIGLYAYRVGLLNRFVEWAPAPLEKIECLEQLRVLWNGERIHVADACKSIPAGVDTPADLARVSQLVKESMA